MLCWTSSDGSCSDSSGGFSCFRSFGLSRHPSSSLSAYSDHNPIVRPWLGCIVQSQTFGKSGVLFLLLDPKPEVSNAEPASRANGGGRTPSRVSNAVCRRHRSLLSFGTEDAMKHRNIVRAVISVICSAPVAFVAVRAFSIYWWGQDDRANNETVLELAIVSLWMIPLAILGLAFGSFARGYRCLCIPAAALPFACWATIVWTEGRF